MKYVNIGRKCYPKFVNADNIIAVVPYEQAEKIIKTLDLAGINKGDWTGPSHSVVVTHSSYGYDLYESVFRVKEVLNILKGVV